jgi:uncharacterized protein
MLASRQERVMLFVVHATDRKGEMPTRAKFYRAHRVHLDKAEEYDVDVVTAGTLLAEDGETPCGSVFVIDAKDRVTAEAFVSSDPYQANNVWEKVQVHAYNRKRGTPIPSRR